MTSATTRAGPLRHPTDAVRAAQQHPPAPDQLPSMYELNKLNPSVSDATVYKRVQKLINAGIVKEVALNDDQRRQGYPWKFYGLTEEGREFLAEHNLLAAEETLQQIHDTIADKPERMVNRLGVKPRGIRLDSL